MLQGLMMQMPLLISSLIEHADRHHGDAEIVSRRVEGDVHRTTYRELHRRARQMANALAGLGIARGERVATLGVERLPAHGAVLRRVRCGQRVAHDQPAAASRADRMDRQSRRGSRAVFRSDVPAAGRGDRAALQDRKALGADDRSCAYAGREVGQGRQLDLLRRLDRRPIRPVHVAAVRREHRLVAVLHVGHDRQSEGRAVCAPLDDPAYDGRCAARCAEPVRARCDLAGGADVPRQRVGFAVHRADGRRQGGFSRAASGWQVAVRAVRV